MILDLSLFSLMPYTSTHLCVGDRIIIPGGAQVAEVLANIPSRPEDGVQRASLVTTIGTMMVSEYDTLILVVQKSVTPA